MDSTASEFWLLRQQLECEHLGVPVAEFERVKDRRGLSATFGIGAAVGWRCWR